MPTMTDQTTTGPDDLIKIGEAATILQCSIGTLRRWTKDGALPVNVSPGGTRRYRRGDVLALLESVKS
jgi:excisionase family DNA binding protein